MYNNIVLKKFIDLFYNKAYKKTLYKLYIYILLQNTVIEDLLHKR